MDRRIARCPQLSKSRSATNEIGERIAKSAPILWLPLGQLSKAIGHGSRIRSKSTDELRDVIEDRSDLQVEMIHVERSPRHPVSFIDRPGYDHRANSLEPVDERQDVTDVLRDEVRESKDVSRAIFIDALLDHWELERAKQ